MVEATKIFDSFKWIVVNEVCCPKKDCRWRWIKIKKSEGK